MSTSFWFSVLEFSRRRFERALRRQNQRILDEATSLYVEGPTHSLLSAIAWAALATLGAVLLLCWVAGAQDFRRGHTLPMGHGMSHPPARIPLPPPGGLIFPAGAAKIETAQAVGVCWLGHNNPGGNFLSRLAFAESGGDPNARGLCGERGLYQFSAAGWEQACKLAGQSGLRVPFVCADDPRIASSLAACYLEWLHSTLTRAGLHNPTPEQLLAAWNLGPTGFRRAGFSLERVPARTKQLIRRFNAK
jgi:hypothetical protein